MRTESYQLHKTDTVNLLIRSVQYIKIAPQLRGVKLFLLTSHEFSIDVKKGKLRLKTPFLLTSINGKYLRLSNFFTILLQTFFQAFHFSSNCGEFYESSNVRRINNCFQLNQHLTTQFVLSVNLPTRIISFFNVQRLSIDIA